MNIIYLYRMLFIFMLLVLFPILSFAGTYWVSPSGTATWANAESGTPLSGTACCSLPTANSNASAGDVIYLRGGTYSDPIMPSNSGSSGNKILWEEYTDESVILGCDTQQADNYYYGILLDGVDYHIVKNIEVDGGNGSNVKLTVINNGANYNELDGCIIHGGGRDVGNSGLHIKDAGGDNGGSKHNWIHDCTFYDAGFISDTCSDDSNLVKIGNFKEDYISHYNTLEDNVFYWGGHHVLETFTMYNVIRNNVFHNECWMEESQGCTPAGDPCSGSPPKWGNRNIEIWDGIARSALYNLIERNRIGHAGPPPDGNGASNLILAGPANIARYNFVFNAGEKNIYLKQGTKSDSDNNRIYNNTCYVTQGIRPSADGIFFNDASDNNVVINNIFLNSYGNDIGLKTAGNTVINNWVTTDGDPFFANPDISDPTSTTLPDLSLRSNSGAIDKGVALTTVAAADTGSGTSLIVTDALYFQDGSWGSSLSNVDADWIAVGTVGNIVQISSINYATNTITLTSGISRNDGDSVWLVKDSSGNIVLRGLAPDIGAYEYPGRISSPKNLRIVQ